MSGNEDTLKLQHIYIESARLEGTGKEYNYINQIKNIAILKNKLYQFLKKGLNDLYRLARIVTFLKGHVSKVIRTTFTDI